MLKIRTYVAPSVIEGVGVFAGEKIEKGQLVWYFNPRFDLCIDPDEIKSHPPYLQEFIERYGCPLHADMKGVLIYESDNGRFMNHSLTPNVGFSNWDGGFALADIAVGTELTCNYHELDPEFEGYEENTMNYKEYETANPNAGNGAERRVKHEECDDETRELVAKLRLWKLEAIDDELKQDVREAIKLLEKQYVTRGTNEKIPIEGVSCEGGEHITLKGR